MLLGIVVGRAVDRDATGVERRVKIVAALERSLTLFDRAPFRISFAHLVRVLVIVALVALGASISTVEAAVAKHPASPFATAAVRSYLASRQGTITAAIYDAKTGRTYCYRPGVEENTASIVKVDILAALLAERRTSHRTLSADETNLATAMIEDSDNDAASDLWEAAGGASAISRFDQAIGMRHTTPNTGGYWGYSTTTACDQVTLLRLIAYPNALLDQSDRSYELKLMFGVEPGQRWGVSAGVPAGVAVAIKNGWLPVEKTWQINSDGYVHGNGRNYVVSVLTADNPSERYGIDTIEGLSARLWRNLKPG